ncbi:MAG: hypothetical protein KJ674_01325 [Nanoarchaeota archaeon]|nr:hypothetical protein [Nanoarchaeota archaeon]
MKTIILDTNFLLIPYNYKIDIFTEIERICHFKYQLSILDKTLDELKKLKGEKFTLNLIKQKNIKVIKTKTTKYVDDILKVSEDIIATDDKPLIKQIKNKPLIILRQKKYLELKNVL